MDVQEWDFWEDVNICGGYDSGSDANLIRVFIETGKRPNWYEDIAKRLDLDENYVMLLMEILSGAGFCEYGTSPRGAWAVHNEYEANVEKLKSWYKNKWNEDFDAI
jgi:hypothetical protein